MNVRVLVNVPWIFGTFGQRHVYNSTYGTTSYKIMDDIELGGYFGLCLHGYLITNDRRQPWVCRVPLNPGSPQA